MTCLYKCFSKIQFPDRDLDTERFRYNKKLEIKAATVADKGLSNLATSTIITPATVKLAATAAKKLRGTEQGVPHQLIPLCDQTGYDTENNSASFPSVPSSKVAVLPPAANLGISLETAQLNHKVCDFLSTIPKIRIVVGQGRGFGNQVACITAISRLRFNSKSNKNYSRKRKQRSYYSIPYRVQRNISYAYAGYG